MYFESIKYYQRVYFPNIPLVCPVKSGPIYTYNITEDCDDAKDNGFGVELPNGRYQFVIHIWTKTDPYVFFATWQIEVWAREAVLRGEDTF